LLLEKNRFFFKNPKIIKNRFFYEKRLGPANLTTPAPYVFLYIHELETVAGPPQKPRLGPPWKPRAGPPQGPGLGPRAAQGWSPLEA